MYPAVFATRPAEEWEAMLAPKGIACVASFDDSHSEFTCTDPVLLETVAGRGLESSQQRRRCTEIGVDGPDDRLAFIKREIVDAYLDHRSDSSRGSQWAVSPGPP